MSNYEVPDQKKSWIYWVAIGLLVVMTVVALLTFSSARSTAQAQDKADELIAALEDAGATAPSQDQVVRVLGEDGGAICEDPTDALRRATLYGMLTNGAAGPGIRPVIADERTVRFQRLVVEIYCPDELEDFEELVADLEFDDVIDD
jgi:Tfp pilus assembly protein FimT